MLSPASSTPIQLAVAFVREYKWRPKWEERKLKERLLGHLVVKSGRCLPPINTMTCVFPIHLQYYSFPWFAPVVGIIMRTTALHGISAKNNPEVMFSLHIREGRASSCNLFQPRRLGWHPVCLTEAEVSIVPWRIDMSARLLAIHSSQLENAVCLWSLSLARNAVIGSAERATILWRVCRGQWIWSVSTKGRGTVVGLVGAGCLAGWMV